MPVVLHASVACQSNEGGAIFQTLVGDEQGSTPVRVGIQLSPPGYKTPLHSHPYLEVLTVLEGAGEAWIEDSDELIQLEPGVTLVIPDNVRHWFMVIGNQPLKVYGVHASPRRVVHVHHQGNLRKGDSYPPVGSSPL
jgi:quercetin dioxygenase-like cupin family protein